MRTIVTGQKKRVAELLINKNAWIDATKYEAIGLEENGELIAGVIYDTYQPNVRVAMHCAGIGKRWLTKEFLKYAFYYPFVQLNVKVIINTVSSNNKDSIKFTEHCGFKEVARIEGGASDGDLIIYVLYKENCKWIRI